MNEERARQKKALDDWLGRLGTFAGGMGVGMSLAGMIARDRPLSDMLLPALLGLALAGYTSWRVYRAMKRYGDA